MRTETQKVLMSVTVPEEDNNGIFCLCLLYHPPSYPQFKANKLIQILDAYSHILCFTPEQDKPLISQLSVWLCSLLV